MRWLDFIGFIGQVLSRHRFRTLMLSLAIAIGVVAVNLLTALGEGAKAFVLNEVNLLGRKTLIVLPGKKETSGGMPPLSGQSPRALTLKDAQAISRLSAVKVVAPLVLGNIEVSYAGKLREVILLGTTPSFFLMRNLEVSQGKVWANLEMQKAEAVCLIGHQLRNELFKSSPALGEWVRAGDRRFRVVGVLKEIETSFGFDMADVMIVPVASAQSIFNVDGLFRMFIEVKYFNQLFMAKQKITALLKKRHEGEEDVTVISQDAMLSSVQGLLDILTIAVGGIASISMLVAGVLIMNMMIITVSQRTKEIGLLKALGATAGTVRLLFLCEAGLISLLASLSGLVISYAVLLVANIYVDSIQFYSPWWAQLSSLLLAVSFSLLFAWLPAQRAASMAPVDALQGQHKRGQ